MACFNCGTTEGTAWYSFDPDLPAIEACALCVYALGRGDEEMLNDLNDLKPKATKARGM